MIERDVEQLEDDDDELLSRYLATAALDGPLLDGQQLIVSHHRAKQLHAVLENLLHELELLRLDRVMDEL